MRKSLYYMVVLLSIVFALTGCLPKTAGQEPPVPVVSIKAYLPENTPDDATIYIIGNYCNWDNFGEAKTSDVKTDDEGKKYAEFELQVAEFPLEYKYTVGPGWSYVEKGPEGEEISNRVIDSAPEEVVIDTVAKWAAIPTPPSEEPEEPAIVKLKAILPDDTPNDATIYVIGSYCGWEFDNAATSEVNTDDEGEKYAEFELEILQFPLEYKYTIGPDWAYVEKDAGGNEIGNRVIGSEPEDVIIDTVGSWAAIPTPPSEEPTIVNIKTYLPENTPDDATIYLVGKYCGWGFDNAATSTVKTEDGQKYAQFVLDFEDAEYPLEYKYTYGASWDSEELDENGEGLDGNRRIDVKPDKDIQDVVLNWKGEDKIDYTGLQEEITVTFVVNVPEGTEDDEGKIYIRGSFNNWGDGTPLHKTAEGTYTGEVEVKSYTALRFKFLRKDNWDNEEIVDANRVTILTEDSTITCLVEGWKN